MDLKMRFNQNKTQPANSNSFDNKKYDNPLANAFNSNKKQSIKTNTFNNIRPSSTTGLNKFKKNPEKGTAPKGQFKKYFVQSNNIFYEERSEIHELEKVKFAKWAAFVLWLLFASSYMLIGNISRFSGECPAHARCMVFVRCNEYFQYDGEKRECVVSSSIESEISDISLHQIRLLQEQYGSNECNDSDQLPSLNIRSMFNEIEDKQKMVHYKKAATAFFQNRQNQKEYGFLLRGYSLIPTLKVYSYGCMISKSLAHYNLTQIAFLALLAIALASFIYIKVSKYSKERNIYNYLKQCVLKAENKTLNVTHALGDLKLRFGDVNEQVWSNVNDLRAKDRQIGYYEDDFLYWKIA